jgi:hypothetical protein
MFQNKAQIKHPGEATWRTTVASHDQLALCRVSYARHPKVKVLMLTSSLGRLKSNESPQRRFAPPQEMPHRVAHGSTAWAVTATSDVNLHQPQDGVVAQRRRVTDIASRLLKFSAGEPEDARLTGGTRSLMRRLSGLNMGLSKGLGAVKAAAVASTARRAVPIATKPAHNSHLTNANVA